MGIPLNGNTNLIHSFLFSIKLGGDPVRKDAKYHKLLLEQSKLKSKLHTDMRSLYDWRARNNGGKAPITVSQLGKQQAEINRIRKQIGKSQIRLVKTLSKRLRHL